MSLLIRLFRQVLLPIAILALGILSMRLVIASGPDTGLGQTTPADERPIVAHVQPQPGSHQPQLMVWAEVQAAQQADLGSPSGQRITQVFVDLGQQVQAGQLLIQLDDRGLLAQQQGLAAQKTGLEAQLASAEQRFRSDRELLSLERSLTEAAENELKRQQTLAQRNLSTAAQLEQAENALAQRQLSLAQRQLAVNNQANERAQLQAQLQQLEAQQQQLQLQLEDLQIRSPINGRVSRLEARLGERASGNLARVQSEQMELQAWVAAHRLTGQPRSARTLTGQLLSEQLQLGSELRSGALELRLQTQHQGLIPGQQQAILLDLPAVDALLLPESSLYPGEMVFVVKDGRLQAQRVELKGRLWQQGQPFVLLADQAELRHPILVTRINEASTGLAVKLEGVAHAN